MSKNIYTSKETTKVANPEFSTRDLANNQFNNTDQLKQEANQEKNVALSIYSQNMNSLATQNMTKAFADFGKDPIQLKDEFDKLKTHMSKTIQDPNMKASFLANYDLQSSSYINKAQANFNKVKDEKKRSAIYDTIVNNDNAVGLSFSNALSGTASPDDYVNYKRAIGSNKSLINSLNPDGTYMFSDSERFNMSKNVNKQVMDNFVGTLGDMEDYKRKDFMNKLASDDVVLMNIENEKGIHQIRLQDTVDPAMYRDMKRKADEFDYKKRKQDVADFNLMRNETTVNFLKNPTEQGLEELRKIYPEASETKIKSWETAVNTKLNENAMTSFDDYESALSVYKDIASMTSDNPEETVDVMNKVDDFMLAVRKGNADGKISIDDLDSINEDVQKMLNDKVFQEQVKNLPDISLFSRIGDVYNRYQYLNNPKIETDYTKIDKSKIPMDTELKADNRWDITKKLENAASAVKPITSGDRNYDDYKLWYKKQGLKTMKDMLNVMRQGGEVEVNGKVITAQDIYNKGIQEAIRYKYRHIPEMQGELVPGESVINLNGLNYVFQGYNQKDILVEEVK